MYDIIAQDHAFCRRPDHITLEVQVGKVRRALESEELKVGAEHDVRAEIDVSVDFGHDAGAQATDEPQKIFNAGARELGSSGAGAGVSRALLRWQPLAPLRV
jgi:hypothetical protein